MLHTTQGYDLNYAGIIFGNEITYDKENDQIVIIKENYFDKNGKQSIEHLHELKTFIINIYQTILLRGIKGTYVYVCDKHLREYLSKHIPRAVSKKEEAEILQVEEVVPFINSVPLFNLKVAAGEFGEIQKVEDVDWIRVPPRFKQLKDFFACEVIGESMNKVIPNGSICLFKKYSGGSRNGLIVLVEHTNIQDAEFGSCYTVKEYQSRKGIDGDQWKHESIILKPLSSDSTYEEIVLQDDEEIALKIIGVFECVLK